MTETLANGYSYESTQRELSNEYQHDRVMMVFKNICVFALWTKVASALEGLTVFLRISAHAGNTLGSSEAQKIMYAGLPLLTFFRKMGGLWGALVWGMLLASRASGCLFGHTNP